MKCEKWLSELGWTQAELARRLGVFPSTVNKWVKGSDFPKYAEAYLELAVTLERFHGMIRPAKRRSAK